MVVVVLLLRKLGFHKPSSTRLVHLTDRYGAESDHVNFPADLIHNASNKRCLILNLNPHEPGIEEAQNQPVIQNFCLSKEPTVGIEIHIGWVHGEKIRIRRFYVCS